MAIVIEDVTEREAERERQEAEEARRLRDARAAEVGNGIAASGEPAQPAQAPEASGPGERTGAGATDAGASDVARQPDTEGVISDVEEEDAPDTGSEDSYDSHSQASTFEAGVEEWPPPYSGSEGEGEGEEQSAGRAHRGSFSSEGSYESSGGSEDGAEGGRGAGPSGRPGGVQRATAGAEAAPSARRRRREPGARGGTRSPPTGDADPAGRRPRPAPPVPVELTMEARAQATTAADEAKARGNQAFGQGSMEAALDHYATALALCPADDAARRSVYLANRAACHLRLGDDASAADDAGAALDENPDYFKALLRRATALERLDDPEGALADAARAVELDPSSAPARAMVKRLEPLAQAKREKLKDEMLGKLKELGNTILGKFGMSLDNFKAEKDPETGSYSVKFQ